MWTDDNSREGMVTRRGPRYSKEEFADRGQEIYERDIRPLVEDEHRGRIVAIDIETGAFEIADDVLTASDRLFAQRPDAQPWTVRIGSPAVYRIGMYRAESE
jgi:hypothetical protein